MFSRLSKVAVLAAVLYKEASPANKQQQRRHQKSVPGAVDRTYLLADERLGIRGRLRLAEARYDDNKECELRLKQKEKFDQRHGSKLPELSVRDRILVRKGTTELSSVVTGPFRVVSIEFFQGLPKRIVYRDRGLRKAALQNVLKFCPRGDNFSERERSSIGSSTM